MNNTEIEIHLECIEEIVNCLQSNMSVAYKAPKNIDIAIKTLLVAVPIEFYSATSSEGSSSVNFKNERALRIFTSKLMKLIILSSELLEKGFCNFYQYDALIMQSIGLLFAGRLIVESFNNAIVCIDNAFVTAEINFN